MAQSLSLVASGPVGAVDAGASAPAALRRAQPIHPRARTLAGRETRPVVTAAVLVACDAAAAAAVFGAAAVAVPGRAWPLTAAAIVVVMVQGALSWGLGLYPPIALLPGEVVRRLTLAIAGGHGAAAVSLAAAVWPAGAAGWAALLVSHWGLTLVLRGALDQMFSPRRWWGVPVLLDDGLGQARAFAEALRLHPELCLKPIAIIRDGDAAGSMAGLPVFGPLRARLLYHRAAVRLIVTLAADGAGRRRPVVMRVRPIGARAIGARVWRRVPGLIGMPGPQPARGVTGPVKRGLDVVLAASLLAAAGPLLAAIALAVRLDSDGPVLFHQKRPGRGGRLFRILKFRTMRVDARRMQRSLAPELRQEFESYGKIRRDPRVTRLGGYLRRTSLDELPQLGNVLRGEMSLVGPRPHMVSQRAALAQRDHPTLSVRPGLTGMWQISGRSNVTWDQRLAMDEFYVHHGGVWLDLYILARTVTVVLSARGAY